MNTKVSTKTYHIMCTVNGSPALLRVNEENSKQALQAASVKATDLLLLFITKTNHDN